MTLRNPWSSYRQVSTQTAAPGQLVLMLFEGAIRFLHRAESGFDLEDPAERNMTIHNNVQRAQDIIHELDAALDIKGGGELASTLRALYEYMDRRLLESNLRKTSEGILEVRKRLGVLRDAWAEMLGRGTRDSKSNTASLSLALA